jgi:hypothetical protein
MTQTPYGPPATTEPAWWITPLKALTATGLVLTGLAAGAVAGFISVIVYSGCFISCTGGNPVGGVLLGALALALALGGIALAVLMWRRARSPRAVVVWAAVVLPVPVLLVVSRVGLGLAS